MQTKYPLFSPHYRYTGRTTKNETLETTVHCTESFFYTFLVPQNHFTGISVKRVESFGVPSSFALYSLYVYFVLYSLLQRLIGPEINRSLQWFTSSFLRTQVVYCIYIVFFSRQQTFRVSLKPHAFWLTHVYRIIYIYEYIS